MAWIKVDHDLHEKPEVAAIASALGLDVDTVVGRLLRLWRWFDKHTQDGCANVALLFLDDVARQKNFCSELMRNGWLTVHKSGLVSVPNFDRHNSKSAKRRVLAAEHMRNKRCAPSATKSPPKRREEKRRYIKPPLPPFDDELESIRESIQLWLDHKSWKYQPRGYAVLLTRFRKRLEQSGKDAVVTAVEKAIAGDYKGWDFDDWFKAKPKAPRLPTPEEDAAWKP